MAHARGYLRVGRLVWHGRDCFLWHGRPPRGTASGGVPDSSSWARRPCYFLLAFAVLLTATAARAQVPAAGPAVRFTVFAAQPIKDVAFVPRAKAAPVALAFQPTARSSRYEYRGPMPLRFVDPKSGSVVAEVNIPPTIQNALLLFSPLEGAKPGEGLRFQVAVLDDGAARHGPGGLAIINFSGLALSGKLNNQIVSVKAGLNPTLPIGRTAALTLSTVFKQRTYQAYSGTITLGRNERALLILFPPFYPGALEVQSRLLVDQPPGAAPAVR